MLLFGFAGLAGAETPCPAPDSVVISPASRKLPPELLARVKPNMTLLQILQVLGPAARDRASGVYGLEWDSTDGRTFRVAAFSFCSRPFAVGFITK
jgi:hypothetical protein